MAYPDERVIVDANIWVAYFDRNDTLSDHALSLLKDIFNQNTRIVVTDFVIQEVMTVLLYKNKHHAAELFFQFVDDEVSIEIFHCDRTLLHQTILFAAKKIWKPKCSFTDWSLAFLSHHFNMKLLSFDKQLLRICS